MQRACYGADLCFPPFPLAGLSSLSNSSSSSLSISSSSTSDEQIVWSREELSGDATYAFTNLYQSGAPQEAVKVTADAAFGALATWLSEQQRLVERAFEVRQISKMGTTNLANAHLVIL